MDTQEIMSIKALIDSGATGLFIDRDYVNRSRLRTRTLSKPVPVYNVGGTPNEVGAIREVVDVVLLGPFRACPVCGYRPWEPGHDTWLHLALRAQPRGQLDHEGGQDVMLPRPMQHLLDGDQTGMSPMPDRGTAFTLLPIPIHAYSQRSL